MGDEFYIESEITRLLDEALITKENLMIQGLTGSGKTSIVKSWLNHYKDKVSRFYLDASVMEECSGDILKKNGLTLYGQLFSSETIDELASLKNAVVVVDNYHLIEKTVKDHIMLLCDGYVVDEREPSGLKELDNIEFVCLIKTTVIG